jgi:indole-3-glycerol phosphate synthase
MALDRFKQAKADELANLRAHPPAVFLKGARPAFIWDGCTPGGTGSISIIAEYKRASPSRGIINEHITPADIARLYTEGGAQAISVLTEKKYFGGELDFLHQIAQHTHLPLLRKDFIFDTLQVRDTATTPASALLLIVALTPDASQLRDLRQLAESFGIEAVVEIFNEDELETAREAGSHIIQVNNRNLETLAMDMSTTLRLIRQRLPSERWIAASGIDSHEALTRLEGYDAALIGSALMSDENPKQALVSIITEGVCKTSGCETGGFRVRGSGDASV